MHRLVPLALAAAAGVVAGACLGMFWLRGGTLPLTVAAVGMVLTTATPVVLWSRQEKWDRQQEESEGRRRRRQRYDSHAEELNEQVFHHLREVRLSDAAAGPPGSGPSGTVGLVVPQGDTVRPLEALPNWSFALEHLQADPRLAALYESAISAARGHAALREKVVETLTFRYTHLLLSQYGFATQLEADRFDPPPWFDVRALVRLALSVGAPVSRSQFAVVPALLAAPEEGGGASPHLVLLDETPIAAVVRRDEVDVAALVELFEAGRTGAGATAAIRTSGTAEQRADAAVRRFAEEARRYSDRILIEHTVSGGCAVCRPWIPR